MIYLEERICAPHRCQSGTRFRVRFGSVDTVTVPCDQRAWREIVVRPSTESARREQRARVFYLCDDHLDVLYTAIASRRLA